MTVFEEIGSFMERGRAPKVKELVSAALEQGVNAADILDNALLSKMSEIGEKFKNNEVFVPEVLVAARAMNAGIEILKPHLSAMGVTKRGTAILGTVKGDLHDIGKNIVKLMLEGKGIEVIDLGVDVEAEKFIENAIEHNADVICCSALLTTTMMEMKRVVDLAVERGIRDKVKIMVGGAPISQNFCDSIGADYYTVDGSTASDVALSICTGAV